jgi:hypothetical protein
MIVVGLDVHKDSLTAVAVDELGRERVARSVWACWCGRERSMESGCGRSRIAGK